MLSSPNDVKIGCYEKLTVPSSIFAVFAVSVRYYNLFVTVARLAS